MATITFTGFVRSRNDRKFPFVVELSERAIRANSQAPVGGIDRRVGRLSVLP